MTTRAAGAAQTRQRILETAFRLFLDHHLDEVTIQRIAEAAEVSAQTVVLHFGSKDGLIGAIVEWRGDAEAEAREVPAGDVAQAARTVCARYEDMGAGTMRLLAMEGRVAAIQPALDMGRSSHRAWVERTFGQAIRAAGGKAARLRRTMELVAAFDVYTWHVLRRVLGPEETVAAVEDLARGIVERGAKR